MSPRRIVQISLWQIAIAFAAVTAAFVFATVLATKASNSAHATADQARQLALENQRAAERADRIRAELVAKIHHQDIVSCRRIHINNQVLSKSIERSLRQTQAALKGPTAKLPGVAELFRRGIVQARQLLVALRKADCLRVPPLANPPPLKASP